MFVPRNFRNITVKSVSFYLDRFQRHGVLKNVHLFSATLYNARHLGLRDDGIKYVHSRHQ